MMTNIENKKTSRELDIGATVKNLIDNFYEIPLEILAQLVEENTIIYNIFEKIIEENPNLKIQDITHDLYIQTIEKHLDTGVFLTMAFIEPHELIIHSVNNKKISADWIDSGGEDIDEEEAEEFLRSEIGCYDEKPFGVMLKKEDGDLTIEYCYEEIGSNYPPWPSTIEYFDSSNIILEKVVECIDEGLIFKED